MNPVPTNSAADVEVELTQPEILVEMDRFAKERGWPDAESVVLAWRERRVDDFSSIAYILGLAGMLDTDHPLYVEE